LNETFCLGTVQLIVALVVAIVFPPEMRFTVTVTVGELGQPVRKRSAVMSVPEGVWVVVVVIVVVTVVVTVAVLVTVTVVVVGAACTASPIIAQLADSSAPIPVTLIGTERPLCVADTTSYSAPALEGLAIGVKPEPAATVTAMSS